MAHGFPRVRRQLHDPVRRSLLPILPPPPSGEQRWPRRQLEPHRRKAAAPCQIEARCRRTEVHHRRTEPRRQRQGQVRGQAQRWTQTRQRDQRQLAAAQRVLLPTRAQHPQRDVMQLPLPTGMYQQGQRPRAKPVQGKHIHTHKRWFDESSWVGHRQRRRGASTAMATMCEYAERLM